jgi:hypothetical protein
MAETYEEFDRWYQSSLDRIWAQILRLLSLHDGADLQIICISKSLTSIVFSVNNSQPCTENVNCNAMFDF